MSCRFLSVLAGSLLAISSVHAGLTLDLQLQRIYYDGNHYFGCSPYLNTNELAPDIPFGTYEIASPHQPTNGFHLSFVYTNSGFSITGGGGSLYTDFESFIENVTNGWWSIYATNATATNVYRFAVRADIDSNALPPVTIDSPPDHATGVTNRPSFTWTGPTNWNGTLQVTGDYQDENGFYVQLEAAMLASTSTNWDMASALPNATNRFTARYSSNAAPLIEASIPTNSAGVPIGSWVSGATLVTYATSEFLVGPLATNEANANLFGHYRFDDPFNATIDSSGNGHPAASTFYAEGGSQMPQYQPDGVAGGAIEFDGFNGLWWDNDMTNVFTGNYSVSLWIKTTQTSGSDTGSVFDGAAILDASGDPMPMVLTGSKLAFDTGYESDTLYSAADINSGEFTHVVITRNAATGLKQIYVNGVLDNSIIDSADTPAPAYEVDLGFSFNIGTGLIGVVDDLQVYTSVLNPAQVTFLHDHPGEVVSSAVSGHVLEAHYEFEDSEFLGRDSSPQGNDILAGGFWGAPQHEYSSDAIAGSGAVEFFGFSSMDLPTELFPVLAGSFSVSAWIKTTQVQGNDDDDAFNGAGVIWANVSRPGSDVAPLVLTGYKAAFFTGDPDQFAGDTLHSGADVSDVGGYVHVVVTRDAESGEKKIYLNGVLDAEGLGYAGSLNALTEVGDLRFGGVAGNSYVGLLDDVQIYSGVLSPDEVSDLFDHPGEVIPDTAGGHPPVDVDLQISIVRNHDPKNGDTFLCFPKLNSVSLPEITSHRVESPNNVFSGDLNGSSSTSFPSLEGLLNECTNGTWNLYINRNDASEQHYTFTVTIAGVDTNFLRPTIVFSPASGSTNVPTNPDFTWSGSTNFNGAFVQKYEPPFNNVVSANLPGTFTNWPSPPTLNPGTNRFYVSCYTNDYPLVTFSTPIDDAAQPIHGWSTVAHLDSDTTVEFVVVSNPPPVAVQILNPRRVGAQFEFSLQTQLGRQHTVEARTNLTTAPWLPVTNFAGDGSLWQLQLPIGPARETYFRVGTK